MVFYRVDQSEMPPNVNVKQKLTGFLDHLRSVTCPNVSRSKKCHVMVIDPDYVTDHVTNYTIGHVTSTKNDRLTDTVMVKLAHI